MTLRYKIAQPGKSITLVTYKVLHCRQ